MKEPVFREGDIVRLPKEHRTIGGWYGKGVCVKDVHGFDDVIYVCPVGDDVTDETKWKLVCADEVEAVRAHG